MKDTAISLTVLGGGQSIGKSCFLLSVGDQHVLLDCGSFVGKDTKKALPDFSKLPKSITVNDITAVLISHFHMDHIGGLLYLTEQLKYKGDIYASSPTRAVLPLLLRNNRVLLTNQAQLQSTITVETFAKLTKHIREVTVNESIQLNPHLRVTAHIAGHVLGAVMWEIEAYGRSVLYTGDFSDEEGSFIPSYQLPARFLRPGYLDMLIMECTYGNTEFKSYEERKNTLIDSVLTTIQNRGKVLIPCYGIGYIQELLALFLDIWNDRNLTTPIYFSSQDTQSTFPLFSFYSSWTSHPLSLHSDRILPFRMEFAASEEPFVLFAAHPTLTTGVSKAVFPSIAGNPKNMVIFLGQNSPDTLAGQAVNNPAVMIDGKNIPVLCQRKIVPFSAHPDRRANCRLIERTGAACVVLIHGDKPNCMGLSKYYSKMHKNGPIFMIPENGKVVTFECRKKRLFMDWREEFQAKRGKETPAQIRGDTIELQKSGRFLELVDSAVIAVSEEDWKSIPRDNAVEAEYVENRGVRVMWTEKTKDRAFHYMQRLESLNGKKKSE